MKAGVWAATLRLQPVVVLYAAVSMCSKWAANAFSAAPPAPWDWWPCPGVPPLVLGILALIFALLALYAFLWQKIIASIPIAVAYSNKSAYLIWTQLGALALFRERVSLLNWLGLAIVLAGVLLVNRSAPD